ncbi:Oidioi.mRNA.OKI2018_I69.chr1.g1874.t1.cds [Oikopleura dioica]|uniref:Oidioi.mRNA.OKI2018_I69.chr1.g1874.t1.cds n=1 Tax=Oikopleura dioica TaxID=34765 RepID=A0ABN7SUB7_OIKDI|nr:Oidioi.mRNA.OKI2018_I69.chr1.g1874.t1.cds [Oikopleura dioica]
MCLNGRLIAATKLGNVHRGLNVLIFDKETGSSRVNTFDFYSDPDASSKLASLLRPVKAEVVVMAVFDDGSARMSQDLRRQIQNMGSKNITSLAFRDSWAFVGAKPGMGKIANERINPAAGSSDKYFGWPKEVAISGCIPKF